MNCKPWLWKHTARTWRRHWNRWCFMHGETLEARKALLPSTTTTSDGKLAEAICSITAKPQNVSPERARAKCRTPAMESHTTPLWTGSLCERTPLQPTAALSWTRIKFTSETQPVFVATRTNTSLRSSSKAVLNWNKSLLSSKRASLTELLSSPQNSLRTQNTPCSAPFLYHAFQLIQNSQTRNYHSPSAGWDLPSAGGEGGAGWGLTSHLPTTLPLAAQQVTTRKYDWGGAGRGTPLARAVPQHRVCRDMGALEES